MKKSLIACSILFLASTMALANSENKEISYLIDSLGRDGCGLVRNKRRFSTHSARAHLQSKWELNAALVHSTEDFITKIASTSVSSGEPYQIKCRGKESRLAGEWFGERLSQYRAQKQS